MHCLVVCRHLNGGQLSNVPSRPALLITDCSRVHIKAMHRATREKALKEAILAVLRLQVRACVSCTSSVLLCIAVHRSCSVAHGIGVDCMLF
jgi:hypothetical protein